MRLFPLACLVLLASACDSGYTERGGYHSVVFTEAGPADGVVDAQAAGDWATLSLEYDGTFLVRLHRANREDPEADGTMTLVTGTYRQRGDRIYFDPDGSAPALIWTNELEVHDHDGQTRLETPRLPGHGSSFRLVFVRTGIL